MTDQITIGKLIFNQQFVKPRDRYVCEPVIR